MDRPQRRLDIAEANVLFDRAVDEACEPIGVGADYVRQRRRSFFTAAVHLRDLRELHDGDPMRVTFQPPDSDAKRLHHFEQLPHATEGRVSATSENLAVHVDTDKAKSAPVPERVGDRLAQMKASHARLPRQEVARRRVGMTRG